MTKSEAVEVIRRQLEAESNARVTSYRAECRLAQLVGISYKGLRRWPEQLDFPRQ